MKATETPEYISKIIEHKLNNQNSLAYTVYNDADCSDICPTITAINCICPGRMGGVVIYENR